MCPEYSETRPEDFSHPSAIRTLPGRYSDGIRSRATRLFSSFRGITVPPLVLSEPGIILAPSKNFSMSNPALGQAPGPAPGPAPGRLVPESSNRGDIDLIFKLKDSQTLVDPILQTNLVQLTVEYDKMILVFYAGEPP